VGQHRVLLTLVEAMDLVDEEHGPSPCSQTFAGSLDHLAQVGNAGAGCAHRFEARIACARDECGERSLAAPRRTPEDQRRHLAGIDCPAQDGAGADGPMLADELVECPRPHPRRQRSMSVLAR